MGDNENKTHVPLWAFLASMTMVFAIFSILFFRQSTVEAKLDVYSGETLKTFSEIKERMASVERDVSWIRQLFESGDSIIERH